MQASQPVLKKACVPKSDGVASATEFVGNLEVGGPILVSQPQDQPTAKDQGLRRGAGADQGVQLLLEFGVVRTSRPTGRRPAGELTTDG